MGKRFKNMLTKFPEKSILSICISTISIILISGMSLGSTTIKSASPGKLLQADVDTARPSIGGTTSIQIRAINSHVGSTNASGGAGSNAAQNKNLANQIKQPLTGAKNIYKSILLDKSTFICTNLANKRLTISDIKQCVTDDDNVTVSIAKFAILDIDGDGEEEVVLLLKVNGISDYGYEILHYDDGEIYGYTLPYRAFMKLKTDGTFLFSGGSSDFGIGKMNFSKTGYSVNNQASSQSGYNSINNLTMKYLVNSESCTKDKFNDMIHAQEQKSDVKWYEFSEKNINSIYK